MIEESETNGTNNAATTRTMYRCRRRHRRGREGRDPDDAEHDASGSRMQGSSISIDTWRVKTRAHVGTPARSRCAHYSEGERLIGRGTDAKAVAEVVKPMKHR